MADPSAVKTSLCFQAISLLTLKPMSMIERTRGKSFLSIALTSSSALLILPRMNLAVRAPLLSDYNNHQRNHYLADHTSAKRVPDCVQLRFAQIVLQNYEYSRP